MAKLQEFKEWITKNKKPLIIAGISSTALIALYLGIKSDKAIESISEVVEDITDKEIKVTNNITIPNIGTEPIFVPQHIRNLPEGQKASLEKLIEAKRLKIILKEGQTIVDEYFKNLEAA